MTTIVWTSGDEHNRNFIQIHFHGLGFHTPNGYSFGLSCLPDTPMALTWMKSSDYFGSLFDAKPLTLDMVHIHKKNPTAEEAIEFFCEMACKDAINDGQTSMDGV